MKSFLLFVAATALTFTACKSVHQDGSEVREVKTDDGQGFDVRDAIRLLRTHLKTGLGPVISKRYATDKRIDACWNNPLGHELGDWQKLLYCHYPLEFRLCLSSKMVLANAQGLTGDQKAESVSKSYDECESLVSSALSRRSGDNAASEGFHYFFDNILRPGKQPSIKSIFMDVYVRNNVPDLDKAAMDSFMNEIGYSHNANQNFAEAVFEIAGELDTDRAQYPDLIQVLKVVPESMEQIGYVKAKNAYTDTVNALAKKLLQAWNYWTNKETTDGMQQVIEDFT